jgi:iron(III) transport system permease protein
MTKRIRFSVPPIPWYIIVPVMLVGIGVVIPLLYLIVRAFEADSETLRTLLIRPRTLVLFANTILLTVGVLASTLIVALPLAWLTTRTDIAGKKIFTLLGVLPLAIPSYVMAYALLSISGANGAAAEVTGIVLPRPSGYLGALLALTLYLTPYLFVNLRSALLGMDPALEETTQSFGYSPWKVFTKAVVPQLRPSLYSGGLLVALHVLGDFGAVSLMRFETFSYALFLQYTAAFDRIYAAWLALFLIVITVSLLFVDARLLRGLRLHHSGRGTTRHPRIVRLGSWRIPAYGFLCGVIFISLIAPVGSILYWLGSHFDHIPLTAVRGALFGSLSVSTPAALLAAVLAIPLAYLGVRYPSSVSRTLERVSYVGYAIPPLAFALSLIFFTLQTAPFLYQTLFLLVYAYTLHYLAEAIGPIRSALYQAPPQLEEAARSLGKSQFSAFILATLPLLRKGIIASMAFVFLSAMKELPLTFLLSPIGFETLALNVWSYTIEAMFAEAAPFALAIIIVSGIFVTLLLRGEKVQL